MPWEPFTSPKDPDEKNKKLGTQQGGEGFLVDRVVPPTAHSIPI